MRRHLPAFASAGRFPGGPASANFFLTTLGRNGSSARPVSPRSRLLQLQQENKKKFSSKKRVDSALFSIQEMLFPPERPGRWWEKAQSDHGAGHGKELKTSPTTGAVREGAYTTTGVNILHSSFNQQSEKSPRHKAGGFFVHRCRCRSCRTISKI
jgi:hypothetical protein